MSVTNYSGWRIDIANKLATRQFDQQKKPTEIMLSESFHHVKYEGWWPHPPDNYCSTMITGICLLDGRWQVEFEQNKSHQPARRSLTSQLERKKICEKINLGYPVKKMYVPKELGKYHETLIAWQVNKIALLKPKRVIYHFPVLEYHHYLSGIEELLKQQLASIHLAIDQFASKLKFYIEAMVAKNTSVSLNFIAPFELANHDPVKSFMMPYEQPGYFDFDIYDCIGLEDLNEVKLAYEAFKRHGKIIPVLAGLIGYPSCYLHSKNLENVHCFSI